MPWPLSKHTTSSASDFVTQGPLGKALAPDISKRLLEIGRRMNWDRHMFLKLSLREA